MTPTEINKKIAEWLGVKYHHSNGFCVECQKWVNKTDYYHTNEAFSLLDVLVERGYSWRFLTCDTGFQLHIYERDNCLSMVISTAKSAAICEAINRLIEKEKVLCTHQTLKHKLTL